ncbi:MAG: ribonuclease HII [Oscillospiraceae bacterium]|jgi:ribonuclease HII
MNRNDLWSIENELYEEDAGLICGVDEAGRGPLCGPVCAAAVILPRGLIIPGLDDSKKLTERKREEIYDLIVLKAVSWAAAFATHEEINELNILNATYLAMNRAIAKLRPAPDLAIVDGNSVRGIIMRAKPVIGGDGLSASIAAASIIAKVTRDRYMCELAKSYPQYGFEKHKGYGTKEHYEALRRYGPSPVHRVLFLRNMH